MVGCSGNDLTLNLISKASMETFLGNYLSSLTTLLPTPMTLSLSLSVCLCLFPLFLSLSLSFFLFGDWQVALLKLSWPASVCTVTEGKITVSKSAPRPESPIHSTNQTFPIGIARIVSMSVPRQFRK